MQVEDVEEGGYAPDRRSRGLDVSRFTSVLIIDVEVGGIYTELESVDGSHARSKLLAGELGCQ